MAVTLRPETMPPRHRDDEAVYSFHEGGRPLLERRAVTSDADSDVTLIDGPERAGPPNLSPSMRGPARPRGRRSSSNKLKTMSMASSMGGIPSITMMGNHAADVSASHSYNDYKVVNLRYNKPSVYSNPKQKQPPKDLYAGTERQSPRQSYLFRKSQAPASPGKPSSNASKRRSSYQPNYRKSQFDPSFRRSTLPDTPVIDPSVLEEHARREQGDRRPSYVSHSSNTRSPRTPLAGNPFASRQYSQRAPPPHPPVDVQLAPSQGPSPLSSPPQPTYNAANANRDSRGPSPPYQEVPQVRAQHSGSTLSANSMQNDQQQHQQQQQQQQPDTIPLYHLHPNARKRKFQNMISRLADLLPKSQWFGRKQTQQGRR